MAGAEFTARCARCDADRAFEEFQRERRHMGAGGDFQFEREFSFRCKACGAREEKIVDVAGRLHKWSGAKHVTLEM